MSDKLLPCPFCGRNPKVLQRPDSLDGYFCAIACYCGGYSARSHIAATGADEAEAYVKASLRWNHRAEPDTGIPRTENKPLTLEELRNEAESGEYGLHVWIKEISSGDVVAAVTDITEDGVVGIWCAHTNDLYRECDYGKTWLAYRQKPEGG